MNEYGTSGNDGDGEQHQHQCQWSGCEYETDTRQGIGMHMSSAHDTTLRDFECKESGNDCSICKRPFETRQGLGMHMSQIHNEPLQTMVKCAWCGEKLARKQWEIETTERFFCGDKNCQGKWMSENKVGDSHPKYKRVTVNCTWCGEKLTRPPYKVERSEHFFCGGDKNCKYEWNSLQFSGEGNPAYNSIEVPCAWCGATLTRPENQTKRSDRHFCAGEGGCKHKWMSQNIAGADHHQYTKVDVKCAWCESEFPIQPHRLEKSEQFFCPDRECFSEWRRANFSGQDNPNWRGGHTIYEAVKKLIRDEPWDITAARARKRDDHECQVCGKHTSEQDRALTANHIPALLDGGCNADELLMAVCDRCHYKAEAYVRALPEVELHLRDWTDNELPEGRDRWQPEDTPTAEQVAFDTFAPADD